MYKTIAFFLLLAIGFVTCGCEENSSNQIHSRNINSSGCKTVGSNAKSTNGLVAGPETITLSAREGGWMLVEHNNSMFNCCTEQFIVKISSVDNTILVDEDEDNHSCNCVCPFDVSYEIGGLEKDVYTLVIRKGGLELLKEKIVYTNELKKTFTIE